MMVVGGRMDALTFAEPPLHRQLIGPSNKRIIVTVKRCADVIHESGLFDEIL